MPNCPSTFRNLSCWLLLCALWLTAPGFAQTLQYDHVDLQAAERQMLADINRIRLEHGLQLLQLDAAVSKVALKHARDMVARDYFAHLSPEGTTPQERLNAAGLPFPVGENLGVMRSYGLSTREITAGLLKALYESPAHRANLLDPRATHIGLAFAQDKDNATDFMDLDTVGHQGAGTVLVVQEFIRKPLKQWTSPEATTHLQPRSSILLTGEPNASFAYVAVEVTNTTTQELVRYQHLPLVKGMFSTALMLELPGKYEVRVLGLQAGALLQSPEELGVFHYTVEGEAPKALPKSISSGPVF